MSPFSEFPAPEQTEDLIHKPELNDPITRRCVAEIYDPKTTRWEDIQDQILALENDQWGDEGFEPERLQKNYDGDRRKVAVLLRDPEKENVIIGFTTAVPLDFYPEKDWDPALRADQGRRTAYIDNTNIAAAYRGHKLAPKLMEQMMQALRDKGYDFLERSAATNNNYAANVQKTYQDLILETQEHPSEYGDQVFFRMRLRPQPPADRATVTSMLRRLQKSFHRS